MANTLTNLIPDLYAALDIVSRELVGLIPAVMLDAQAARAAVNQTLRIPLAPASTAADVTPASTAPDTGDQTFTNATVTISKSRAVPIRWTGEETLGINSGVGFQALRQAQFAQAMRTLTNEVEADLAALYAKASRAYGTAGTAPFGTAGDYSDASQIRKILADNGAPLSELQLVLNTTAGANLRGKQAQAYMVGDTSLLRQGVLGDFNGMAVRESAQIKSHTKGTGASATTDNAGYAVGSTSLTLASAGTGTLLAGDVVTFAGDTANKYVVTTGDSDVSNGGTLVLGAPGIQVAMSAATKAITVGNSYAANLAFARSAILLAARAPALPDGGDMADDRTTITDPRSGLSFEVSAYRQYRRVHYEVALAWGVAAIKPEHIAILLG
ncbi:MAG: P22 phage major capsid protein family protein [Candidatus Competibacter sp.]|nr:P22 phage major capsid protein family protein [Candidatus Competibacter sp.]MDS4059828.1 P22 phage major capsid protein family protein [Candidatus Contendobacter sp.]